jgi:hypothetical protein
MKPAPGEVNGAIVLIIHMMTEELGTILYTSILQWLTHAIFYYYTV